MTLTGLISIWIVFAVLFLVIIYQGVMNYLERKANQEYLDRLSQLIKSNDMGEYARARGMLAYTPKDRLKQTKAENDLAKYAATIAGKDREEGLEIG